MEFSNILVLNGVKIWEPGPTVEAEELHLLKMKCVSFNDNVFQKKEILKMKSTNWKADFSGNIF